MAYTAVGSHAEIRDEQPGLGGSGHDEDIRHDPAYPVHAVTDDADTTMCKQPVVEMPYRWSDFQEIPRDLRCDGCHGLVTGSDG